MPIETHCSTIESATSFNNKFVGKSKLNYYEKMKEVIEKQKQSKTRLRKKHSPKAKINTSMNRHQDMIMNI